MWFHVFFPFGFLSLIPVCENTSIIAAAAATATSFLNCHPLTMYIKPGKMSPPFNYVFRNLLLDAVLKNLKLWTSRSLGNQKMSMSFFVCASVKVWNGLIQ